jgi:hypothetical protein
MTNYVGQKLYTWCHSADGWQLDNVVCPDVDQCETDALAKADFVNFILNITGQSENPIPNPVPATQGFCAIDLQPLFDDSETARTARENWAKAEFKDDTMVGNQHTFQIVNLAEYVQLASETSNGNTNPNNLNDNPIVITWTLNYAFSSIQDIDAFKAALRNDFATALGIPTSRIIINLVAAASTSWHSMASATQTVVGFTILPAPTNDPTAPTAAGVKDKLLQQFKDPNSDIYSGTITSHTASDVAPVSVTVTGGGNGASAVAPSLFVLLVAAFFAWRF